MILWKQTLYNKTMPRVFTSYQDAHSNAKGIKVSVYNSEMIAGNEITTHPTPKGASDE